MAKIQVFLRQDMQNFGYIRLNEKGEPFYSYPERQATEMSVEDAIKLVDKLSNKYLFKIQRDRIEVRRHYSVSHYILC